MRPLSPVPDAQRMSDLVPVHSSGIVMMGVGDETGMGVELEIGLGTGEGDSSVVPSVVCTEGGERDNRKRSETGQALVRRE